MPDIEVGPGEKALVLVLQRQLFPHDGFVTHKAIGGDGKEIWYADLVQSGQRWSAKTRRELFEKFAQDLLNKDYLEKRKTAGRPRREAKTTTLNLTFCTRDALEKLSKTLGVDWGTTVSYLVLKAHASMIEDMELPISEPIDKLSDTAALTQSIREASFGKPKTHKQMMSEFEAKREAELAELAHTMRLEMELEQETKEFVAKQVTDELSSEEAAAERRIKRED